jgi:hypothetical protein
VGVVAAKEDVVVIGTSLDTLLEFFGTARLAPVSLHITVDGKSGRRPEFSRGSVFWGVQ